MGIWAKLREKDQELLSRAAAGREEERWKVASQSIARSAAAPAVVVLAVAALLLFITIRNEQSDERAVEALNREGAVAVGTVTNFRMPLRHSLWADEVRIEFATESGESVSTWVPSRHSPERGWKVEVRYVRSDPSVVRLPGDETPNRGRWVIVAVGGPVMLGVVFLTVALMKLVLRAHYDPA